MPEIQIDICNKTKATIDKALVKKVVSAYYNLTPPHRSSRIVNVSLAFIGDKRMRTYNRTYRAIDSPTDILSFESDEEGFAGELVIDLAQIERQAKRLGHSQKKELIFIIIHGLLHLDGHTDDTDVKRLEMIKRGEDIMKKMGVS